MAGRWKLLKYLSGGLQPTHERQEAEVEILAGAKASSGDNHLKGLFPYYINFQILFFSNPAPE